MLLPGECGCGAGDGAGAWGAGRAELGTVTGCNRTGGFGCDGCTPVGIGAGDGAAIEPVAAAAAGSWASGFAAGSSTGFWASAAIGPVAGFASGTSGATDGGAGWAGRPSLAAEPSASRCRANR